MPYGNKRIEKDVRSMICWGNVRSSFDCWRYILSKCLLPLQLMNLDFLEHLFGDCDAAITFSTARITLVASLQTKIKNDEGLSALWRYLNCQTRNDIDAASLDLLACELSHDLASRCHVRISWSTFAIWEWMLEMSDEGFHQKKATYWSHITSYSTPWSRQCRLHHKTLTARPMTYNTTTNI